MSQKKNTNKSRNKNDNINFASNSNCINVLSSVIVIIVSVATLVVETEGFSPPPSYITTTNSIIQLDKSLSRSPLSPPSSQLMSTTTAITDDTESNNMNSDIQSLDPKLLKQILEVATDASSKACDIILKYSSGADVVQRKANTRDLLTEVDPQCEQIIRDTILSTFPTHNFLGEEDVPPGSEASATALSTQLKSNDWLWIVDPIDGTTNFVHGMPLCMPSVACCYKGQVVVGVIMDPHRNEIFQAIKGQGSKMNGQPIHVSNQQTTLRDAIIAMGSPPGELSMDMSLKGVAALMPKVRTIRMLGSAALMLAWVANGRLTAYWEYDLSSWDIAAGALLIQEAGGSFTDFNGVDFDIRNRKICATNGHIHDELLKELNAAGIQ